MSEQPTQGGRRQGTPGRAYSNRTDLSQNYGGGNSAATGGMAPATPAAPAAAPAPTPGAAPAAPPSSYVTPDETPGLFDPTVRPDEPLMSGADRGPGPGRPMSSRFGHSAGVERLRQVYRVTADESVRELLEFYDRQGY